MRSLSMSRVAPGAARRRATRLPDVTFSGLRSGCAIAPAERLVGPRVYGARELLGHLFLLALDLFGATRAED